MVMISAVCWALEGTKGPHVLDSKLGLKSVKCPWKKALETSSCSTGHWREAIRVSTVRMVSGLTTVDKAFPKSKPVVG